jgi:hypothetical protein
MNEIIININEANKAQKYQNENELFQIDAFKRVSEILKEHKVGRDTNDITDCRFHDTIFIDGDRGVGKTAFMVNIENYYNKYFEAKAEDIKDKPKYIFLKSVDPTLLEHTEKFLGVILGKIVEIVSKRLKNNCIDEDEYYINNNCDRKYKNEKPSKNCIDGYYKALENLSKSLSSVSSLENKQDVGIEEIASYKSSQKLEQYAHEFFKIVSTMFGVNAIVMLIDDVDMAFDKGFDVLEVVRKYLASPYLIPIVAGDLKLYREIVETKFMDKIDFLKDIQYLDKVHIDAKELRNSVSYKDKIQLIDHLVEQYLRKLFPSEYQIQLKSIVSIKKEYMFTVMLSENIQITLSDIENFELKHINLGINRTEFYFKTFSDNTRDFIQYLYSKKDIYKEYFENKEKYKNNMNFYKNSFMKTAEFYKFSHDRKKKELSILTNNDYQSFEEDSYNLYKAFTSKLFSSMKKFQNVEISVNNYSIKAKELQIIINEDDGYKNISNYIIDLFIFNDYYSSYQRRNYIYSGKFLEMLIFSFSYPQYYNLIDKKNIDDINSIIDNFKKDALEKINLFQNAESFHELNDEIYSILYDKTSQDAEHKLLSDTFNTILINTDKMNIKGLKKIANKIPFGSEFLTNNRYKQEYFGDDDADEVNECENKYDLTELSRNISIWRNVFLQNIELNSISLFEIIYKFFMNIEKIKDENNRLESLSYKEIELDELKENKPVVFLQRIVLMFINAVAFFESDKEKVANINIAIGKTFNLENILSKTSASLLNIKPMFEKKNSLTRALFFHPIISLILFPQDDSKLNNLEFVGQKLKVKENKQKNTSKKNTEKNSKDKPIIEKLNNLYNNPYSKYFKNDSYQEGVNAESCYEDYLQKIIDIYNNQNLENKEISQKLLSDKYRKYHKVFNLILKDMNTIHPWFRDDELVKNYQNLVYNAQK